jgi:hypothetical protein
VNAATLTVFRDYEQSWARSTEQERRYRRIQLRLLAAILLLSILFHWLPVPQIIRTEVAPTPLPIQIQIQRKPLPPPPPPVVKPQPVPPPAAPVKAIPPPRVTEKPRPVHSAKSGSAPPSHRPSARERAAAAGIADIANDLASLRDSSAASKAITGRADLKGPPNPRFTSALDGGAGMGAGSERSLITARAGRASGGINTAGMSRGFGGGGLAGRGTTLVAGYGVGGGGGVGNGHGTGSGDGDGTGDGTGGSRSHEEIEMVFDQNKGAIYALYNRALRVNPGLRGKLVLRLTILPSGVVSACSVVSSELHDPTLEHALVLRVRMFKFQARDVATVTTTKPIDFFPGS